MNVIDLFKSSFEQPLHEGAVDAVTEQEDPTAKPYVANFNDFNTPENRENVKKIWTQIQAHFLDPDSTWSWLTLKFPVPPNSEAVTLSPNQVWSILKKLNAMSRQNRTVTLLTHFGDRNNFMTWLNSVKVTPRPVPKKDVPKGQGTLDLKEAEEKKSSEKSKYRDVAVQRAVRQAQADFPTASSDTEAFIKSMMVQQDQDQKNIDRLKSATSRTRELINKNNDIDQTQAQTITDIQKEIDQVEQNNTTLSQMVSQMSQANAALQAKLDQMRRGRPVEPAPELGVSVATDKVPTVAPTSAPASDDQKSRQQMATIARNLRKKYQQLASWKQLASPGQVEKIAQQQQQILNQLQQAGISTAEPATVGGEPATVLAKKQKVQPVDDIEDFEISPEIAGLMQQLKKKRGRQPATMHEQQDLTAQDILFRTAAKAMYDANQQGVDIDYEEAIKIASKLMRIPYAPSQLPALQSQLADVEKKIATLKSVRKSQRQREREKLTHQTTADEERRAAEWMKNYGQSLQNRLKTRQTESEGKKHSSAWEQGGREGYYGRPKDNPYKKGTEEYADWNRGYDHFKDDGKDYLRELDLDRSGQPMYKQEEVYMLTHDGREVAFYRLKDLKQAEQDAREMQRKLGGEVHIRKVMREGDQKPADDDIMSKLFRDFGEIFGKPPAQPKPQEPEKKDVKEGRAGYGPLLNQKHWEEVEQHLFKLLNDKTLDPETRAEVKQRWLDKQREAKLKGFK